MRLTACMFLASLSAVFVFSGCQPAPTEPTQTSKSPSPGEALFATSCSSCHGMTGQGASTLVTQQGIDFTNPTWQKKYTDAQLSTLIKNGKGAMPAFGSSLKDSDLALIVSHIRSLSSDSKK